MEHNGDRPVEYIGVGKPETVKRSHPVVAKARNALGRWWERVGPKSVEKSWVSAHERILKKIDGEERKQVFTQSQEKWRKVGKGLGIASTAIDFSLAGLGVFLSIRGFQRPVGAENRFYNALYFIGTRVRPTAFLHNAYYDIFPRDDSLSGEALSQALNSRARSGRVVSGLTGLGSIGILFGGLSHIASRVAARVAGIAGKGVASGGNYVASGKAREHAEILTGAVGSGISSAAKYAVEHPEEVRKTFETVERVRRENEMHRLSVEQARQAKETQKLQERYENWLKDMDPGLRAYYEHSGSWPPSIEVMLKERQKPQENLKSK